VNSVHCFVLLCDEQAFEAAKAPAAKKKRAQPSKKSQTTKKKKEGMLFVSLSIYYQSYKQTFLNTTTPAHFSQSVVIHSFIYSFVDVSMNSNEELPVVPEEEGGVEDDNEWKQYEAPPVPETKKRKTRQTKAQLQVGHLLRFQ
jgi:hypothetical protein